MPKEIPNEMQRNIKAYFCAIFRLWFNFCEHQERHSKTKMERSGSAIVIWRPNVR